ncbi:MAG: response regulator [Jhaorihella sp.]
MDDSNPFAAPQRLSAPLRPLLGLTVLVVEDSRYACDAMRLLCLRSGARIRRADCLASARRHLQIYRPSIIIVDVGLPDGSGLDLIGELAGTAPRIGVILGISGDDCAQDAAIAAGADGFLRKPLISLAAFQAEILSHLPAERRPPGPRGVADELIRPDPLAYIDDMEHVADVLSDQSQDRVLDYVAQFVGGIARSADDTVMADAAEQLARSRSQGGPVGAATARIAGLVQERLQHKQAI